MATTRKDDTDAAAAEPLTAEIAALRADLTELGQLVARIGKDRAAGLQVRRPAPPQPTAMPRASRCSTWRWPSCSRSRSEIAAAARRRPFASLGLAALVGVLFGVLFRR